MVSALKEKTIECPFLLSPFIHTTRRGHVSTQWGGSAHKPREEAQYETYPIAHTLIQDFQPAECEQRQSCCLSQEVCRNLCCQGLPTKTMCYSWKECWGSLTKENYQLYPENFALRQSRICPFSSRLRIFMNSYSRSSVQDVHHCPWRSWAHTVLQQSKESAQKTQAMIPNHKGGSCH